MTNWITIKANSNLIQNSTDRAYLIKLPKSELMFWHPSKLVRFRGKKNYLMSISFTDSFIFKCFRNGKGKTTFNKKIEEIEYNHKEIQEIFDPS
tara:strand:- start:13 stop:294 length:282 start_codon:yes stop_codon:yes gene_type:complete